MQKLQCDGCGFSELIDQPKHKIKSVKLVIVDDPRFPEGMTKHEADLCPTCQGNLLHNYFDVPAEGKLNVPGFIEPTDKERELKVAT